MKYQEIAPRHIIPLLISLLYTSTSALAGSEITGTVPFRIHEHLIIVQGSVDGSDSLNLALDTGACFTVLSKQVGKKLGLKGVSVRASAFGQPVKMKKVDLARLTLGRVEFEQVEARLCDLPPVDGVRLDGLIGLNVLKRATVTLDFEKGDLVFGQARQLSHNTRFYGGLNFIPVTMTVNGKALRLALDTAACGLVLYRGAIGDRIEIRRTNSTEYRFLVGGRVRMEEVILSNVVLADSYWEELPAYLMDRKKSGNENVMGNLGVSSLGLKTLQFDVETGQLGWEP